MTRHDLQKTKELKAVYDWLRKYNPGLLNKIFPYSFKWNLELCKQDALKYNTRSEWEKNSRNSYGAAHKHKWAEVCCSHMKASKTGKKWTLELCRLDALKYNTRSEWQMNSVGAYAAAHRSGWLDECSSHMKENNKWTSELCKLDALKYDTRNKWRKNSSSAYTTAHKNKWLDECCSHMEPSKSGRKLVINLDTNRIFKSISEAKKLGFTNVSNALKNRTKCGGYRWAYCDEKGNILE